MGGISKSAAIKLILEYIGGKKVMGNPVNVQIAASPAVIQSIGGALGSLSPSAISGVVSSAIGGATDLAGVTGNLFQNPLSSTLSQATSLKNSIGSAVSGLSGTMDAGLKNSLTSSVSSLTSALTDFTTHTDALAGVGSVAGLKNVTEVLPLGGAANSILGSTETEIKNLTGSYFDGANTLNGLTASMDPAVDGGLSSLIAQIEATDPTDTATLTPLVNQFNTEASAYVSALNAQRAADIAAQSTMQLKVESYELISNTIPSSTDTGSLAILSVAGTQEMANIVSQVATS